MSDLHFGICFLPALLVFAGCGANTEVREYEVKREEEAILTSDILRDQFEAIPFRWSVPGDWRTAENDQFSEFAWTAGPSDATARITVSGLPGSAGIEPQFARWRGQLELPEVPTEQLMRDVEELSLSGLSGQWIEIRGTSESILGMIAPYRDKLWVIKFRGANSTATAEKAAFRSFCESLRTASASDG